MNFYETSFLFFAFLGLLHGVFFFLRHRGDFIANRFLGVYLLLFALNLLLNTLFWSKLLYTSQYIHFFGFNAVPWLCYGPLFFLYQKRLLTRKRLHFMESLHFLPLVIYLLSKSSFYFLDADTKLASIADGSFRDYGFPTINMAYFAMLQMSTYGAVSIISKTKNKTAIPKENAIWTNFLITAFFGYLLCFITYFIRIPLGYYSLFSDYIICYFIVLFVGSVAYFGIVQPHIFEGPLTMKKYIPFTKYERTGLSKGYSIELKKELQRLMEQEKPYLDSDIRLDDLAEMLDVPRHHASQIINENFNSNFFDFMNQYRIREAELALKDKNSGITIQKIAYQSGFNNRVSFYKAFKKVTGMTPSQYKNK